MRKVILGAFIFLTVLLSFAQEKKEAKYLYKIASEVPAGSIWHTAIMNVNRELVKKTNGEVRLQVYAGGIMGDQASVINKMTIGQIQGATFSNTGMQMIYHDFGIVGFPLTLRDQEEYDYLVEQKGAFFENEFKKKGYKFLCWTETGPIYIYSKKIINSEESLRGAKAFVLPGDKISEMLFKEVKATPIPVQTSDILTSLKTGQIDTVFSPPYGLIAMQWYTNVNYASDFIVTFMIGSIMVDNKMFESMPREYQTIMEELFRAHIETLKHTVRKDNIAAQEALKRNGIKFVEISDDAKDVFYQAGKKANEKLIRQYGYSQKLFDEITQMMKEFRSTKKSDK